MQSLRQQIMLVLAVGMLAFINLGSAGLFDEDEPKNAACGQEMFARGDWIVPTFNDDLRTDKPILLYWLMLVSFHTLGVSEFSARLVSALFATGTALVTYHLGRKLYNSSVGLWAGLILGSSLMFDVTARAATPDAVFIFFCTSSLLAYVVFGLAQVPRQTPAAPGLWRSYLPATWYRFVPIYVLMGFAVLAKGPAGIVLPCGAIGLFLLVVGDGPSPRDRADSWLERLGATWRQLRAVFSPRRMGQVAWAMRPLTAIVTVSVVALPWYIAVGIETDGAWLTGFLGKHNVGRFVHSLEGHRGPIFYYVVAIAIGFFPWSVFLLPTFLRWRDRLRNEIQPASDRFVACWALFYIGFFSLAGTKLPNYVLPAYPALALLTAALLVDWLRRPELARPVHAALAFGTVAAVGIGLLIALPVLSLLLLPGDWWLGLVGLIPLGGGLLALRFLRRQQLRHALLVFGCMALAQSIALFDFASVRVARHQTSRSLIASARAQQDPLRADDARFAVFDYFEPSLVFYARNRVERFRAGVEVRDYFNQPGTNYLVTHEKFLPEFEAEMPAGVQILARKRRFLRRGDVLLIGRPVSLAGRPTRDPQ